MNVEWRIELTVMLVLLLVAGLTLAQERFHPNTPTLPESLNPITALSNLAARADSAVVKALIENNSEIGSELSQIVFGYPRLGVSF